MATFESISLATLAQQKLQPWAGATRPIILVVDDETVIADTLAMILGFNAITGLAAYNAEAALEMASLVPPDLLLSDVMMPGMSGVDLAIAMRKLVPSCKVLLFSGQAATVDLLSTARALGYDFTTLQKPIHHKDLLAHIRENLQEEPEPAAAMA